MQRNGVGKGEYARFAMQQMNPDLATANCAYFPPPKWDLQATQEWKFPAKDCFSKKCRPNGYDCCRNPETPCRASINPRRDTRYPAMACEIYPRSSMRRFIGYLRKKPSQPHRRKLNQESSRCTCFVNLSSHLMEEAGYVETPEFQKQSTIGLVRLSIGLVRAPVVPLQKQSILEQFYLNVRLANKSEINI